MKKRTFWIVLVLGDVQPERRGPYKTDKHRLRAARRFHNAAPWLNGILRLNIGCNGVPALDAFSNRELR